jgi:hypothetical protein
MKVLKYDNRMSERFCHFNVGISGEKPDCVAIGSKIGHRGVRRISQGTEFVGMTMELHLLCNLIPSDEGFHMCSDSLK